MFQPFEKTGRLTVLSFFFPVFLVPKQHHLKGIPFLYQQFIVISILSFEYVYTILEKEPDRLSSEEMINLLFNIEREMELHDYNNLFRNLKKLIPDFDEKEMWFNS